MNWYKKLIKTAEGIRTHDKDQEGWYEFFGDLQRYGMDPYQIRVYSTKTNLKRTVAVVINNNMVGTLMWQKYWMYDLSEESAALKVFKEVIKRSEDVIERFRADESPNTLMWTYLKDALHDVDPEHVTKTNIPYINWSQKIVYEKDARSQIYGNRYPIINGF